MTTYSRSPEEVNAFVLKWPFPRVWYTLKVFLNGVEFSLNSLNSVNSGCLINHSNMNWVQFKDLVSYVCLVGCVVISWSLTEEVVGSMKPVRKISIVFVYLFLVLKTDKNKDHIIMCLI